MLYLYAFLGTVVGNVIGWVIFNILKKKPPIIGYIEIDHESELCGFKMVYDDWKDRDCHYALMYIHHDAHLSDAE